MSKYIKAFNMYGCGCSTWPDCKHNKVDSEEPTNA